MVLKRTWFSSLRFPKPHLPTLPYHAALTGVVRQIGHELIAHNRVVCDPSRAELSTRRLLLGCPLRPFHSASMGTVSMGWSSACPCEYRRRNGSQTNPFHLRYEYGSTLFEIDGVTDCRLENRFMLQRTATSSLKAASAGKVVVHCRVDVHTVILEAAPHTHEMTSLASIHFHFRSSAFPVLMQANVLTTRFPVTGKGLSRE